MATAPDLEKLQEVLRHKMSEYFGDKIEEIYITPQKELVMRVHRDAIVEICTKLRDDRDFQFDYLAYLTAVDYSALDPKRPRYEMVYNLLSLSKAHRMRVKAAVPEEDAAIDTVYPVWKTADWQERETFDMFGIVFKNHPDLRRILMPDDWEGHPLRKDFPLGGVKSFYFKRSSEPRAGEPADLVPRIRQQLSDI